jgi:hypothetical protein
VLCTEQLLYGVKWLCVVYRAVVVWCDMVVCYVQSSARNVFAEKVQNGLMPEHTYSVVYGGDPEHIPDLTWQQLRDFHKTYYHPSNARSVTAVCFSVARMCVCILRPLQNARSSVIPYASAITGLPVLKYIELPNLFDRTHILMLMVLCSIKAHQVLMNMTIYEYLSFI